MPISSKPVLKKGPRRDSGSGGGQFEQRAEFQPEQPAPVNKATVLPKMLVKPVKAGGAKKKAPRGIDDDIERELAMI